MALEAAVYQQNLFVHSNNNHPNKSNNGVDHDLDVDLYPLLLESWAGCDLIPTFPKPEAHEHVGSNSYCFLHNHQLQLGSDHVDNCHYDVNYGSITHHNHSFSGVLNDDDDEGDHDGIQLADHHGDGISSLELITARPKRRRSKRKKKQEEIENQRMAHIAVERNRRKQMNDYLSVLRSMMPPSYVQRGDQASIIGGAINFVKELEQSLQCLSAKKQMTSENSSSTSGYLPFGEFFSFPQYSCGAGGGSCSPNSGDYEQELMDGSTNLHLGGGDLAADVEVRMAESHALVKIRTKQPPKQVSKLVAGLQGLGLTILHFNATKLDGIAFYSFSVKVEDESSLTSVEEIASAVYQLLGRIQDQGTTFYC